MKKIIMCLGLVFLLASPALAENAAPEQEKGIVLPIILNVIPGLGIGSFVQGDGVGGLIMLFADLGGAGCILAGYLYFVVEVIKTGLTLGLYQGDFLPAGILVTGGLVLYLCSKVFGIIRPIWFGAEYNAKLKQKEVAFNVLPVITLASGDAQSRLGLQARLTFQL